MTGTKQFDNKWSSNNLTGKQKKKNLPLLEAENLGGK